MRSVYENNFANNYMFTYQAQNSLAERKAEETKRKTSEKEVDETSSFSFLLDKKIKTLL